MLCSFWKTYSPPAKFLLHACFCLENDHLDVFEFLVHQEEDTQRRYNLSPLDLQTMFKHTKLVPIKLQNPAQRTDMMLGVAAEEDIKAGDIIARASGFFWPKMTPMPTAAEKGFGPFKLKQDVPFNWGFEQKMPPDSRPSGFRFMLSARCPVALVNDYHGIAEQPNGEFIQFTSQKAGDDGQTDTLQIGIKATMDIKKGEQILCCYGDSFWSSAGPDPSAPSQMLLDAVTNQTPFVPNKIYVVDDGEEDEASAAEEGEVKEGEASDAKEGEVDEGEGSAAEQVELVDLTTTAADLTTNKRPLPADSEAESGSARKKVKPAKKAAGRAAKAKKDTTKKAVAGKAKKAAAKKAPAKKDAAKKAAAKKPAAKKAAAKKAAAKKPSAKASAERQDRSESVRTHKHTLPSNFASQHVCPLISAGR